MPYDHQGRLVEAVDCASCNSSLEWHGRLPEDPNDVVCNDCNADQLTARAEKAEAEVERLRIVIEGIHLSCDLGMCEACDDVRAEWRRPTAAKPGEKT